MRKWRTVDNWEHIPWPLSPPYLPRSEGLESSDGDLVVGADLVVVRRVIEGQRQQTLLLQIRL